MKKIIVIDDDHKTRKFLEDVITVAGFEALVYDNAVEAFKALPETRPHLIIVDEMLPQMNGFKFCGLVKSNTSLKHIPVILFTARMLEESGKQMCEEVGVDCYMEKTGSVEKILEVIRRFLSS